MKNRKAFTLLEIIITASLLSFLAFLILEQVTSQNIQNKKIKEQSDNIINLKLHNKK